VSKKLKSSLFTGKTPLVERLVTDHALFTFLWAWWRAGVGASSADEGELGEWLDDHSSTPAQRWCKVAFTAGREGISWQGTQELLKALDDPATVHQKP
jgi:hypothetical protein